MWGSKSKESQSQTAAAGGDFEAAAARVTAEVPATAEEMPADAAQADKLEIRPEWAEGAARLTFLPAARLSHPAYALTDEEAEKIAPHFQALMQAVADRYAPAAVGRVASRHPELFDCVCAVAVLYWQKWRMVSKLQAEEKRLSAERQQPGERREAEGFAARTVAENFPEVVKRAKPGDHLPDGENGGKGTLVI